MTGSDWRGREDRAALRLGPLLRYVDATSATVWVETEAAATVRVTAGEVTGSARTFAVHGHHYALVVLRGLAPGTRTAYSVTVDDEPVWPEPGTPYGPSVIATLEPGRPLRMAFGSCRVSVGHDAGGNAAHGVDALRAYALHLAGLTTDDTRSQPDDRWPDLLLFLGDQVYADETSAEMKEFIARRRDPDQAPWYELKDFEEYAHLYRLAWGEEANRWLLSTLPSAMIFDDHDIRDDWNTSLSWRRRMEATDWWHDRIVGGLASYWVHQHLGNLAPSELAEDPVWQLVEAHDGPDELDLTTVLDAFAERADQDPTCYRWSFARQFDTQARLVVVDSRAARVLEPERRSILDDDEMAWLDGQLRGDVDHLLVGTSLPYLLSPALHRVEAFSEAVCEGAWGRLASRIGEWLRQAVDMEHWAAFQDGFVRVGRMVLDVAEGRRGRAPHSVTFLSGDVHHSYVAQATPADLPEGQVCSAIVQAVCSPIRNPLPRVMRMATALASHGSTRGTGRRLRRAVPRSPLRWRLTRGPWYDNNLALLELRGSALRMWWTTGEVLDGRHDRPRLRRVAEVDVAG